MENESLKIYSKLHKIRAICPPSPRITQNSHNLRQFPRVPFFLYQRWRQPHSDLDHGKWNSKNLQQIAQNLLNLPTLTTNHAKFASFAPISIYSKLYKICSICPPSPQITQNSHHLCHLQQIVQNLRDLPTLTVNHEKFAQSAPIFRGSLYTLVKL